MSESSRAASRLADLAHALESGQDADTRVRHALRLLRSIVSYDRCVLVHSATGIACPTFVEPPLPPDEERRMVEKARALLQLMSDPPSAGGPPPGSPTAMGHLAVPLISLDEVGGVLLVERTAGTYDAQDLQLLSVVSSQLGAYLATLRLRDQEQRAAEALREVIARRTHFLGLLSHELRNPLAPIGNAIHILDQVDPGSEQALQVRRVIARQFQHLSRLVGDLLDATRVTTGKVHLQRTRADLGEIVRRTADDHRSVFQRQQLTLSVEVPSSPVWVDADPDRISQVLGNLLGNAAKFSNPGGRTEVVVAAEGTTGTVRVRDDGVGITPEILGRLFQPFAQGDETLDRSRGGLGLGLALAKSIVELHGGTLVAHSAGRGRGAEFTARLPLAEGRRSVVSPPPSPAPQPRRILVVEDNRDAAATLRDVLELSGHAVEVAHEGREALERAAAFDPEVVLCDIGLPGLSGYDVARALRSATGGGTRFLVALTGYGLDDDRRRVLDAGFDVHLVKPVGLEQIERVLAEHLGPDGR